MTARQVAYLLTVAEEHSVDAAARKLRVPPDDITAKLMALESELGGTVLERGPSGLRLTPTGRSWLVQVATARHDAAITAPTAPTPAPEQRQPAADGPARPSRRAVLLGAGATGLVAVGAAAVGWPRQRARAAGAGTTPPTTAQSGQVGFRQAGPTGPLSGGALIEAENAKPGSPDWVLARPDPSPPRAIEGFTDRPSASHGETVTLFVRSRLPMFAVEAYRLGWYGGAKARLVWATIQVPGGPQPEPTIRADTKMVDCSHWTPSLTFTPDERWVHGQYLLKLVQSDGEASYVPFVVRSDAPRSDVLVVAEVTTGAAYETWGGHSLYSGLTGGINERADVVSLDRPLSRGYGGAGWLLGGTTEIAQLLESQGVDVSYTTNVDQHARPGDMANHHLVISGAHDEYYSPEMRFGLQAAVDRGVNVMFLGANAIYRKIRFEDSPLGANRRIVNYRSARTDPVRDRDQVTTNWPEGPAPMPESSLTANWYESNEPGLTADLRIVDGDAWMFAGTGLTSGSRVVDGVREEYDRIRVGKPLPEQLQILAHSPLVVRGKPSVSDMTYATLPSGAAIFNSGTLMFQQRMGPLSPPGQGGDDGALRRLVWNLVDAFRTGPAGGRHPAQANVHVIYPHGDTGEEVGHDPSM